MSLRQHRGLVLVAFSCLCVVHLCANVSAALSSEFEADLQKAEAAQEERREPLQGLESSIIALSPKALLANGDGDISTIGASEVQDSSLGRPVGRRVIVETWFLNCRRLCRRHRHVLCYYYSRPQTTGRLPSESGGSTRDWKCSRSDCCTKVMYLSCSKDDSQLLRCLLQARLSRKTA